ncbi:SGNH hydrolase domain-containing protein, partial [Escherichia coli]|nr:SGNH hydrolase domain-containing protein [Escherichia coli]
MCSSAPQPAIAVLGNSHSMVYVKRLSEVTPTGVVQLTQDSCAVGYVDILEAAGSISCRQFFNEAVDTILSTPSIRRVVISSNFNKELS